MNSEYHDERNISSPGVSVNITDSGHWICKPSATLRKGTFHLNATPSQFRDVPDVAINQNSGYRDLTDTALASFGYMLQDLNQPSTFITDMPDVIKHIRITDEDVLGVRNTELDDQLHTGFLSNETQSCSQRLGAQSIRLRHTATDNSTFQGATLQNPNRLIDREVLARIMHWISAACVISVFYLLVSLRKMVTLSSDPDRLAGVILIFARQRPARRVFRHAGHISQKLLRVRLTSDTETATASSPKQS